LARFREIGATTLTISGANPFLFEKLPQLLDQAGKIMEFIHLDTNLVRNNDKHVFTVAKLVDLLGVPLDGSIAKIHDGVRSTRGHHAVVCRLLPKLIAAGVPVKINTVVTRENCHDLKGAVRNLVGIRWGASPGNMKLSFQAARSIG
jgi:MoaA/NifB/PqqE/SkfB family radical SAM enzyme